MDKKTGDILTIGDLAACLEIPNSTLYKLVREGMNPRRKIRRHWRSKRGAIVPTGS